MFSNITPQSPANEASSRRKFTRRRCDRCVAQIDEQTYPIEDWSLGGVRVFADSKMFSKGKKVTMNMKFKLRDRLIDIPLSGTIIRKAKNHIAIEFDALSAQIRSSFQCVVDDHFDQILANAPWART